MYGGFEVFLGVWAIPSSLGAMKRFEDSKFLSIANHELYLSEGIKSIKCTILPEPLSHGGLACAVRVDAVGRW